MWIVPRAVHYHPPLRTGLTALAVVAAALLAGLAATGGTPHAAHAAPRQGVLVETAATGTVVADQPHGASTAIPGRPSSTAGLGYSLESSTLIGESGLGLRVYVDPHAPQHAAIAAAAAASVSALRSLGLDIRWSGYGTPAAVEGVVAISEGVRGCVGAANRIANTFPYLMTLPSGDRYMYRAQIVICPRLYTLPTWQWAVTVTHELGHAVGLDHTNYVYAGSYQLMNAANHRGVTRYQRGDIAGLRTLASNSQRVKNEVAPVGRLEDSHWNSDNTITLQGWSLLSYFPNDPVLVTIRDNGKVVSSTLSTGLRPDVNRAHAAPATSRHGFAVAVAWTAGDHSFCVTVTSTKIAVANASLGCATWKS